MAGDIVEVSSDQWKSEVLESTQPVLVDFWAEWCAPCRALAPVLQDLSSELAGRLKIAKVNVDQYPDLASQFGVRSIPTLVLIKQGQEASRLVGAMNKAQLKAKLEPLLV
jgi:thioredoxin 1